MCMMESAYSIKSQKSPIQAILTSSYSSEKLVRVAAQGTKTVSTLQTFTALSALSKDRHKMKLRVASAFRWKKKLRLPQKLGLTKCRRL